ncbi:reverse transcriptase domain-containing protein [Halomonas piscis]|uniref:Reverse transcriptase domain-containing protein n=1 Tax=Halomonas piscis TaxID=3031727 RepID=A0ABY9Z277_9GAMM|nr:reverse transcriptase domain-containing protein [Halomonas piscis]WNK20948.1 reverse transcriptase domain-containing protein [Halomonas piscis]
MQIYKELSKFATLEKAWKSVRKNAQASNSANKPKGLDEFEANTSSRLKSIQSRIARRSYKFHQQKGVVLEKESGGYRPIVVYALEDRIVQRAILDVLQENVPKVEEVLRTPTSFGAIPQDFSPSGPSGVKNAIEEVMTYSRKGYRFFYRTDIPGFFTKVEKRRVIRFIENEIDDFLFLDIFNRALDVSIEGAESLKEEVFSIFPSEELGISQGSSLSPLLANIYLYEFDRAMIESENCVCLRYLDDLLILSDSNGGLQKSVHLAKRKLGEIGLSIYSQQDGNKEKYSSGDLAKRSFEFLGCDITNGSVIPSRKSKERLLSKVEAKCRNFKFGLSMMEKGSDNLSMTYPEFLEGVRRTVLGWSMSYRFCNHEHYFKSVDKKVAGKVQVVANQVGRLSGNEKYFSLMYGISTHKNIFD